MDYLKTYMNDTFYKGVILGTLMGLGFSTIKSYIFKKKCLNFDEKSKHIKPQGDFTSLTTAKGEYKMALLVRHDLKMGKGKVAAQCSHATVHCYEEGLRLKLKEINAWELNNKLVDIFKVADEKTMLHYKQMAIKEGLNTYIVVDAGRTQVAPKSKTVMAIGPAKYEQIDDITQNLSCAAVSVTAFTNGKLCGLPSNCARVVLRVPDLKNLECIKKQCKLFGIQTASFKENNEVTVLAIGPANEFSINAQVHNLKLY